MRNRLAAAVAAGVLAAVLAAVAPVPRAHAQECRRVVIFTLPGVTWEEVDVVGPTNLLAAAEDGAAGSVSVRTVSSRTDYGDGFATIGAGNRVRLPEGAGATSPLNTTEGALATIGLLSIDVSVPDFDAIEELADHDATGAQPGALGSALGDTPLIAIGNADLGKPPPSSEHYGRWTLLAAMDRRGEVDIALTGAEILADDPTAPFGVRTDRKLIEGAVDRALEETCSSLVVDQGDLVRADALAEAAGRPLTDDRRAALRAADDLLGNIRASLDPARDLLLIVSPTSPAWDEDIHLGIAVAVGPGYPAGTTLESASTRQAGIITLPDVAPTVLEHLGIDRPPSMSGRSWTSVTSDRSDRIAAAIELDKESVFVLSIQAGIATSFVIFQVAMYVVSVLLLRRRDADDPLPRGLRWLQVGALAVVAFPLATYLATPIEGHAIGTAWFVASLVGIDAAVVTTAWLAGKRPLDRLLVVTACTVSVLIIDQVLGGPLQLNGVFGTLPIIAGRFTGLGNTAFTVLGTSALLTGALLVHRWPAGRWALTLTAGLFVVTVVVDGAPWLGSDVGGVVALVPALAITWVLLSGRRVTAKMVALATVGMLAALALFLALDFARPEASRTHFARLVEDVGDGGADLLYDTIRRKVRANVRVFTSTIWTYLVPPAVLLMALLLLRPRGRWRQLAVMFPRLRAGLIGGLVLAVIGFFVNDSGIVIPAMALSFLVPMTLLVHLTMSAREAQESP